MKKILTICGIVFLAVITSIKIHAYSTPVESYTVVRTRLPIPPQHPKNEPEYWDTNTFINMALGVNMDDIKITGDLVCLAKNIYFEARNQNEQGQLAIAFVTKNRVDHPRWPNNICDVVYQYKQFSWYSDGKSDNPKNPRAWDNAIKLAAAFLNSYNFSPVFYSKPTPDITEGATHYHADYVDPTWAYSMVKAIKIGSHIFYQ